MPLEYPDTVQMDMELVENPCTIPEYYRGKVIFLTGFTGFIGKLLVEKLLWSCPDVKLIYLLVRPKKGQSPQQRIHTICKLPIFNRLREREGENFLNKLVALSGDTSLPELGLAEGDRALLRETNIIFNGAASVRFDDPLTDAFKVNTISIKYLLGFALEMPNFDCFVHLSTAYTNCDMRNGEAINEQLYPPLANWQDSINVANKIDPCTLSVLSYKYTQHMPNTYVFTKRLAENILAEYTDRLPIVILRPSIVIATSEEPVLGWMDTFSGPSGLMSGYGVGVIRTSFGRCDVHPDFYPVDYVNRATLTAPWYLAHLKRPKNLMILHACGSHMSLTIQEFIDMGLRVIKDYPMKFILWKPSVNITSSEFWFTINVIFFQLIPGILIDSLLKLAGKKQILWKLQIKIYLAMINLHYFMSNYFNFKINNLKQMGNNLLKNDHEDFKFYFEEFDYYKYYVNASLSFQRNVLCLKEEDIGNSYLTRKMFNIADAIVKLSFWSLVIWNIYKYQMLESVFHFVYNGLTDLVFGSV